MIWEVSFVFVGFYFHFLIKKSLLKLFLSTVLLPRAVSPESMKTFSWNHLQVISIHHHCHAAHCSVDFQVVCLFFSCSAPCAFFFVCCELPSMKTEFGPAIQPSLDNLSLGLKSHWNHVSRVSVGLKFKHFWMVSLTST